MGCAFAKNDANVDATDKIRGGGGTKCNDGTGGGGDSGGGHLPAIPPPAPVDPRIPLTARQRFSIGKSWKGISRAMEPTGVAMFMALFEEHQDLLDLFGKFQGLRTKDEQADSLELQQHAAIVMQTLDESIQALENADYFFQYVHQVGGSHIKIKGYKKEYFWRIEKPFLKAVKQTLGERYTDNMDTIYSIVIHFILENLVKGFVDAETAAAAASGVSANATADGGDAK